MYWVIAIFFLFMEIESCFAPTLTMPTMSWIATMEK